MATQPSYRVNGANSSRNDTKRIRWEKICGALQNEQSAPLPQNNPQQRDTIRTLKVKCLRILNKQASGGL